MAGKRKNAPATPATTVQRLASLVKSCRATMRKDKGLSGDLDRLPQLTWIMFLKFLDDLEQQSEAEAVVAGDRYSPLIPAPYRWRDWASKPDGITGPELLAFVNQDEAILPNGKRGPGLFAKLKSLSGIEGADRCDVVARVFAGTTSRMSNGYLLREVVNKLNDLHFTSSEELHTLSALYEGMLREMRDAAGDSGEFYTPRPVVKFMVAVTDPRLGETVLDPACGTGGFLVEAYEHLEKQVKTTKDREVLQTRTLYGGEAKPLPYLLGEMNLLLHGVEIPNVDYGNSLAVKLGEIGDKDRVDIILTNPPFGGEEEAAIKGNFPSDMQTSETALLFLQLIMRKLRRQRADGSAGGRGGVVLPDGVLSQEGVAVRIREMLMRRFRLHTVVRLPRGVFEPYTKSSTSLLFFDTGTPADTVWYYEVRVREGLKAYTLTKPFLFEDLRPCLEWWHKRQENDAAWRVPVEEIARHDYNLNFRHPDVQLSSVRSTPDDLVLEGKRHLDGLEQTLAGMSALWKQIEPELALSTDWPQKPLTEVVEPVRRAVDVRRDQEYSVLAVSWYARGLYVKHRKMGRSIKASKLYRVEPDDFIYNRLFAWKGSFAEVAKEHGGCYVSNEFPCFSVDHDQIVPGFLWAYFSQPALWEYIETLSSGTTSTSRLRLKEARLLRFRIPVPPRPIQERVAELWRTRLELERDLGRASEALLGISPAIIERAVPMP